MMKNLIAAVKWDIFSNIFYEKNLLFMIIGKFSIKKIFFGMKFLRVENFES